MSGQTERRPPHRGGVMITVLIFSAVIAVSLTSYVRLATNAYQLAQRGLLDAMALSLSELGIEHGMSAFNHIDALGQAAAFNGWLTNPNGTATATLGPFDMGNGVTGVVKVHVLGCDQAVATPAITAKAIVTPPSGPGITRYLQITLRRRSVFVGMLSTGNINIRTLISFFAAWNSLPHGIGQPAVAYTGENALAGCFIGTVGGGTNTFNGARIFGRIANDSSIANVSHNGSAILASAVNGSGWNNALYSSGFAGNPPTPTVPALPTIYNSVETDVTSPVMFPRGSDVPAANGVYYYDFLSGATIATGDHGGSVTIKSGTKCVFYLNHHAGTNAIQTSGLAGFRIQNNATLQIYTDGNIACEGLTGVSNANDSSTTFIIYGTNPTRGGQSFSFFGLGAFIGSINAPNANVNWTGINLWLGAIIAHDITFALAGGFIYDMGMLQVANTAGSGNPWGIAQWSELSTAAQRVSVAGLFSF